MEIGTTNRGFGLAHFTDVAGNDCSIQDSSLATEACIWFGMTRTYDLKKADRMHLTMGMARKVALAMKAALAGAPVEPTTFTDRYGSTCSIHTDVLRIDALVAIGVTTSLEGDPGIPMQLGAAQIEVLLVPLMAFLTSGYISGEMDPDVLEEMPKPPLDVKIPISMLDRADVGETGVSTREILDAFRRLFDVLDDLQSCVGHDDARTFEALHKRLKPIPDA